MYLVDIARRVILVVLFDNRTTLGLVRLRMKGAVDELTKIFEAGWRASNARTPAPLWGRSAGAGLGLAIVRGIVEAHSGQITVQNIPGGCRFDVRLPGAPIAA